MEAEMARLVGQPGKQDTFGFCLNEGILSCTLGQFCSFGVPQNNCNIVLTIFFMFLKQLSSQQPCRAATCEFHTKKITSR